MELSAADVWSAIRAAVRERIPEHAFQTWIAGAHCVAVSAHEIILEAPSPFHAEWLEDKYGEFLLDGAAGVLGSHVSLVVRSASSGAENPMPSVRVEWSNGRFVEEEPSSSVDRPTKTPPHPNAAAPARGPSEPVAAHPAPLTDPGLFSRYTFDRFVVGGNNQLADAAGAVRAPRP